MLSFVFSILVSFTLLFPLSGENDGLLEKGKQLYSEGRFQEAAEVLKQAVKEDKKNAEAFFYLGCSYREYGSLDERRKSETAFKKAIELDRDNVNYMYEYAILKDRQGFYWKYEELLKKILKIDPSFTEASLKLVRHNINKVYLYKNKKVRGTPITYEKYRKESLRKAEEIIRTASEADPENDELLYLQGTAYVTDRRWKEMNELFSRAVEKNPENKDAFLFLGYSFCKLGRFREAETAFGKAKSLMSTEELAVMESYREIITPKQKNSLQKSLSGEKPEFTRGFWKKKDPSFLTGYNERQIEHYSRIAIANLLYTNIKTKKSGWKTERGQVLIRFGEPGGMTKFGMDNTPSLTDRRNPKYGFRGRLHQSFSTIKYPKEYWVFNGFIMKFEDRLLNGDFTIEENFDPLTSSKQLFDEKIRHTPEEYNSPIVTIRTDFNSIFATFKGENGNSEIDFYYSLPLRNTKGYQTSVYNYFMMHEGGFLFDEDWNEIDRSEKISRITHEPKRELMYHPLVSGVSFTNKPGRYNYAVEFKNNGNTIFCSRRDSVTFPDYQERGLQMSDVVTGVSSDNSNIRFERFGEEKFVPLPYGIIAHDDLMMLYYELYNLHFDGNGRTSYEITTEVAAAGDKGVKGIFNKVTGQGKKTRISNTFSFRGESANEKKMYGLDIRALQPGKYRLVCRIRDLIGGRTAEKGREITIIEIKRE